MSKDCAFPNFKLNLALDFSCMQIDTAPIDPRFTATNQSRHCFVRYNEAHKCYAEKGEDAPECARIARDYRALCPTEWVNAWNEARENGTWFGKY